MMTLVSNYWLFNLPLSYTLSIYNILDFGVYGKAFGFIMDQVQN